MVAFQKLLLEAGRRARGIEANASGTSSKPFSALETANTSNTHLLLTMVRFGRFQLDIDCFHTVVHTLAHMPGGTGLVQQRSDLAAVIAKYFPPDSRCFCPFPLLRSSSLFFYPHAQHSSGSTPYYVSPYYDARRDVESALELAGGAADGAASQNTLALPADAIAAARAARQDYMRLLLAATQVENLRTTQLLAALQTLLVEHHAQITVSSRRVLRIAGDCGMDPDAHRFWLYNGIRLLSGGFFDEQETPEFLDSLVRLIKKILQRCPQSETEWLPDLEDVISHGARERVLRISVCKRMADRVRKSPRPTRDATKQRFNRRNSPSALKDNAQPVWLSGLEKFYGLEGIFTRARWQFIVGEKSIVTRENLAQLCQTLAEARRFKSKTIASPEVLKAIRDQVNRLPVFSSALGNEKPLDAADIQIVLSLLAFEEDAECVELGCRLWKEYVHPTIMELSGKYDAFLHAVDPDRNATAAEMASHELFKREENLEWVAVLLNFSFVGLSIHRRVCSCSSEKHLFHVLRTVLPTLGTRLFLDSFNKPSHRHELVHRLNSAIKRTLIANDCSESGKELEHLLQRCLSVFVDPRTQEYVALHAIIYSIFKNACLTVFEVVEEEDENAEELSISEKLPPKPSTKSGMTPTIADSNVNEDGQTEDVLIRSMARIYLNKSLEHTRSYSSGGENQASQVSYNELDDRLDVKQTSMELIRETIGNLMPHSTKRVTAMDVMDMLRFVDSDPSILERRIRQYSKTGLSMSTSATDPAPASEKKITESSCVGSDSTQPEDQQAFTSINVTMAQEVRKMLEAFAEIAKRGATAFEGGTSSPSVLASFCFGEAHLAVLRANLQLVSHELRYCFHRQERLRWQSKDAPDSMGGKEDADQQERLKIQKALETATPLVHAFLENLPAILRYKQKVLMSQNNVDSSNRILHPKEYTLFSEYVNVAYFADALSIQEPQLDDVCFMLEEGLRMCVSTYTNASDQVLGRNDVQSLVCSILRATSSAVKMGLLTYTPPSLSDSGTTTRNGSKSGLDTNRRSGDSQSVQERVVDALRIFFQGRRVEFLDWESRYFCSQDIHEIYVVVGKLCTSRQVSLPSPRTKAPRYQNTQEKDGIPDTFLAGSGGANRGSGNLAQRGDGFEGLPSHVRDAVIELAQQCAAIAVNISSKRHMYPLPPLSATRASDGKGTGMTRRAFSRSPHAFRLSTAAALYSLALSSLVYPIRRVPMDRARKVVLRFASDALRPQSPGPLSDMHNDSLYFTLYQRVIPVTNMYILACRYGREENASSKEHAWSSSATARPGGFVDVAAADDDKAAQIDDDDESMDQRRPQTHARIDSSQGRTAQAMKLRARQYDEAFNSQLSRHAVVLDAASLIFVRWGRVCGDTYNRHSQNEARSSPPTDVVNLWIRILDTSMKLAQAVDGTVSPLQQQCLGMAMARVLDSMVLVADKETHHNRRGGFNPKTDFSPKIKDRLFSAQLSLHMYPYSYMMRSVAHRVFLTERVETIFNSNLQLTGSETAKETHLTHDVPIVYDHHLQGWIQRDLLSAYRQGKITHQ